MKIIDSRIVDNGRFVKLVAVTYTDREGRAREWRMASRAERPRCLTGDTRRPDAVIIVPYHRRRGKLVVIREFRVPVGGHQYGFPAGLLDPGEDPETTAARELKEETGLDLVKVYRRSPAIFSSAGITDEAVAMVFAEVEGRPGAARAGDSEEIEVFLMDREEVGALLRRGDIAFGARAWLAMDAFVRVGRDYLTGA